MKVSVTSGKPLEEYAAGLEKIPPAPFILLNRVRNALAETRRHGFNSCPIKTIGAQLGGGGLETPLGLKPRDHDGSAGFR
jgi:hypothetical protein